MVQKLYIHGMIIIDMEKVTQDDYALIHSRARKIEIYNTAQEKENTLYWCDMTIQAVNFIKAKIDERNEIPIEEFKL